MSDILNVAMSWCIMPRVEKLKSINYQKLLKYGFFGATTAGIEFIVFLLLSPWAHIYVASTASFLIGLVASFIFNKFIVFRNSKQANKTEVVQFLALGLTNSQLSSVMTWAISTILPSIWAKIISMGAIIVWNYLLMNFVIFKKK